MTVAKRILLLLSPGQRRSAAALLGLMLIGTVLETLGVGLVLPVLTVMTRGDLADDYPAIEPWLIRLGSPSQEQLVVFSMLTLAGVAVVKALFLGFLAWWGARFSFGLQADLSRHLLAGYLHQPYAFHLQRNSAQLIRNIISQVDQVRAVVQTGLMLVAELLVLVGISVLLLTVEPIGMLWVVSTLGLAGWGFQRMTRDHLLRWGMARQLHEGLRIQHLQQGLGGVKEVILLGREDDFTSRYQVHNAANARVGQYQATLLKLPLLWFELLAVCGVGVLVIVMMGQSTPLESLLPTLGLFAAASFRVLPSVTRVLNSVQNMRFAVPVINNLHTELSLMEAIPAPRRGQPLRFESALVLNDVSFRYEAAEDQALRGVSLSIPRGSSAGFIGTTGAGKSTLVDVILGLLTPDCGSVLVDGVDIQTGLRSWQDQIGYVPQSIFLTDDTLRRNVAFGLPSKEIDESAVWQAIRAAQLGNLVGELPQGLDTVVGERGIRLSGGQRQRIGIARALYQAPSVLVLDEATSSLDTDTERSVMEAVGALQGEKTLLIVSHRLSTVEHCDRLFRLDHGRLLQEGESSLAVGADPRAD